MSLSSRAAAETDRVVVQSPPAATRAIEARALGTLRALGSRRDRIEARIEAIDREWDVERALETSASTLALTGTLLAAFVDRRFAIVPAVVGGFLLQHALQGWCPPLPVFRSLGFRTAREIERERHALKALRGDYRKADATGEMAWEAASR